MGVISKVTGWFRGKFGVYGDVFMGFIMFVIVIVGAIIFCMIFGCGDSAASVCEKFCQEQEQGDFSYEECLQMCKEEGLDN